MITIYTSTSMPLRNALLGHCIVVLNVCFNEEHLKQDKFATVFYEDFSCCFSGVCDYIYLIKI